MDSRLIHKLIHKRLFNQAEEATTMSKAAKNAAVIAEVKAKKPKQHLQKIEGTKTGKAGISSEPPVAKSAKPPIKVPKSLGAVADLYFSIREKRLSLDKQSDEIKAQENYLREHLINNVPKSELTGVAGKLCRVTVVQKESPIIEDYQKFLKHVVKTSQFELLTKSVSKSAIKERWEDGKKVPGIGKNTYVDLSVSKV